MEEIIENGRPDRALEIKVPAFEGPMDLLLNLIEKNKIDIYDIPIARITDQYMDCLKEMETEDMEQTSQFLLMAATLMDIKLKLLLPKKEKEEEEQEDPREELLQRLLEYKKYKAIAKKLEELGVRAGNVIVRPELLPREVEHYRPRVGTEELLKDLTLSKLETVFETVLRRKEERTDPIRSHFGTILKEEISVSEQMESVSRIVQQRRRCNFRQLLEKQQNKIHVIVTFLAILELMKLGKISIRQEESFGEISVEYTLAS